MTDETKQYVASGGEATQTSSVPPDPAPEQGDRPVHLFDAVATQRDHVLNSYETQRSAIMQAVAEQREAAVAPIRSVQQRQGAQEGGSPRARFTDAQAAGIAPGSAALPLQRQNVSAAAARQQLVAADIAATLRTMIAEEVGRQLSALLDAADRRVAERAAAHDNVPSSPRDGGCS